MIDKRLNPFINGTVIRYNEVVTSIDGYGNAAVIDSYEFELDSSVRVYNCKDNRIFLFQHLSMYARDILMGLYYFVNHDYQYVIVTYDKVLELYGGKYSRRRYDDTIKELIRYNILDSKDKVKGQFWYNPVFFAAGNRLTMYPECKLKISTLNKYKTKENA